jgi:arylsulfatase A-like enzyme
VHISRSSRRRHAGIVLATVAALSLIGVVRRTPERDAGTGQPNVVLIVIDTLRPDHLSHYGYPRQTAAGFDALARHATRFEAAFSPSSWTAPSAASLHTGMLPVRHGVQAFGSGLNAHLTTLAELLSAAGWHTVGHSFNHHVSGKTGFAQGFDAFDDFLGGSQAYPDVSVMVERVRAWLGDRPRRPFFLYLHPMNTHGPYRVPPAARATLLGRPPAPGFVYYGPLMSDIVKAGALARRADVDAAFAASLVEQYDTAIRHTIDQLGRVLRMLDDAGVYDDSLIIVTADHGEELFDHGGFSHGYSLHRELVHVPLYVKLPRQTEPAAVHARVSLADVVPTIADVVGIPVPGNVDGVSLRPLLDGGRPAPAALDERPIVHEVSWPERCVARAILLGRHKLIEITRNYEGRTDEVLLYDVETDPGERIDVSPRHPDVVARLRGELERTLAAASAGAVGRPELVIRSLDRERLRALGYL